MKNDLKIVRLPSGHWIQAFFEAGLDPHLAVEDENGRVIVFPSPGCVDAAVDLLTRAFEDSVGPRLH